MIMNLLFLIVVVLGPGSGLTPGNFMLICSSWHENQEFIIPPLFITLCCGATPGKLSLPDLGTLNIEFPNSEILMRIPSQLRH
jgi:hypothetical protein